METIMLEKNEIECNSKDLKKMSKEEFYNKENPKNYKEFMKLCGLMNYNGMLRGRCLEGLRIGTILKDNSLRNFYICQSRLIESQLFTFEYLGELCDLSKQRVHEIYNKEIEKDNNIETLNLIVEEINDTRRNIIESWEK